ncbi:MAG: Calx-beta domain-containing protein [Verrucomicrobiia bacterium]
MIIAGDFTQFNGNSYNGIARLNPDGTLDYTFNPGTGADGPIYAIAVQTNGAVLIGGSFTEIDSKPRNNIARLNPDGSLDLTFNPGAGANDTVYSIVLRPSDEHAYIGGKFTSYNYTRRMGMALLRTDGTLDTTFMDTAYNQFAGLIKTFSFEPNHFVRSIALQGDGNLMIGGSFTNIGGNHATWINLYGFNNPLQTLNLDYYPVWTRQDKITRMNVARVIGTWGGTTDTNGVFTPNPPQGPGNIQFITDTYYIDENQPVVNVTLMRNGVPGAAYYIGTGSALVTPLDRLAVSGEDYSAVSDIISFGEWFGWMIRDGYPGPVYYQVRILDDELFEGNETLDLLLSNPEGSITLGGEYIPLGTAIGNNVSTLVIVDDEKRPGVIAFSSLTYATNENAGTLIATLIRTNGSDGTVTVDYFTRNGSAISGVGLDPGDFTSVKGTLTFAPGVTNLTISIPLYNDNSVEPDEYFYLVLTNAGGGAKLPGGTPKSTETATCLIIDDDLLSGRIQFESASYTVNEAEGQIAVRLLRRGGSVGPISVTVVSENDTATAGSDFTYYSNKVSWVHNDTEPKTIIIPIKDDLLVEGAETFRLTLKNPSVQGGIGSIGSAVVTIVDDDSYGEIEFGQSSYIADENGGFINVVVRRISGISGKVTVNYATKDGTGIAGVHYIPASGTLEFNEGEVSKSFTVRVIDNDVSEGDYSFFVELSSPTGGAVIRGGMSEIKVVDNESTTIPAGSVDTEFTTGFGPDKPVHTLAIQRNGFILLGGEFTSFNSIVRKGMARLDPIGRLDTSFNVGTGFNDVVKAVALQPDEKIIAGGLFTNVAGYHMNRVVRLNKDGSVDTSFNPGDGADGPVYSLAIQNDGKILVGGGFVTFNSVNMPGIVRLTPEGKLNASFNTGVGVEGTVYTIAIQNDSKILIGGKFTRVNNLPYTNIARLNPDGSVDTTFNIGSGADGAVRAIIVQFDNKIVVGGSFSNFNGRSYSRLVRLNPDGTIDNSFMAGEVGANDSVYALALQPDEKIVVAGVFTRFNGVTRNGITRLNKDGSTDLNINFGEGANAYIGSLAIQPDRKIIIGGGFTAFDGKPRNYLTRLHGGSLVTPSSFQFTTPYYYVNENQNAVKITILRRGGTAGTNYVAYATIDNTAIAGEDYESVTNVIEFPPGEVAVTIGIPIINDTIVENTEDFFVYLDLPSFETTAQIGVIPVSMVSIINDDCVLGFSMPEYRISENAPGGVAAINVTRVGSSLGALTVNCYTVSNIFGLQYATPYTDFYPTNELLVFEPGVTSLYFNVMLVDDAVIEPNEMVLLQLSDWQGEGTIYPGFTNAVLTIQDNEPIPGVIEFAATNFTVFENQKFAEVSLVRKGGTSGNVSARLITVSGTAIDGLDFIGSTNTIYFSDCESNRIVYIPIINDTNKETDETFNVYLSNPQGGAALGFVTNAVVTIYDDDFATKYVKFSATNYVASEGEPAAVITVFRLGLTNDSVSVNYAMQDGTARNGRDYLAVSGTLTWAAGDSSPKTITIPIINDAYSEPVKTATIKLSGITAGYVIATDSAALTIIDDDVNNYGANNVVRTVVFDELRNVYIGGDFTVVNSIAQGRIARLTTNSVVDTAFNTGSGFNDSVYSIALNTNGQMVVAGNFTRYNDMPANRVLMLDTNGYVIPTFNPSNGPNATVRAVAYGTLSNLLFSARSIVTDVGHTNNVFVGANSGTINMTYQFPVPFVSPTNTNALPIYTNTFEIVYDNTLLYRTNILVQSNDVVGNLVLNFGPGSTNYFSIIINRDLTNGSSWSYSGTVTVGSARDRNIYIAGDFTLVGGSAMNKIARLTPSGAVDLSFNPGLGANDSIYALWVLDNEQIIVAGNFASFNRYTRNRIARLNPDGSVDETFDPGLGPNATVYAVAVQPDGKILIAGQFTTVCGAPRASIARLNSDGTLDLTFDPDNGANGAVRSISLLDDGRIIIAGDFTQFNGNSYNGIARLNPDGSLDDTFYIGAGANGPIYAADFTTIETPVVFRRNSGFFNYTDTAQIETGSRSGTITIDYDFGGFNNNMRVYYGGVVILNLTTNGTGTISVDYGPGLETSVIIAINEVPLPQAGPWSYTATISGGSNIKTKIAIGGDFTRFGAEPRGRIAVLNEAGTVDDTFYPRATPDYNIYALSIYTNGMILLGGSSKAIVGVNLTNLARLTRDGLIDTNFNIGLGPDSDVRAIAIQTDSSFIIGGAFTNINGIPRTYLARIFPNGMIDPYFNNCDCYNGIVNTIALQPDGKIIVGGEFTLANGAKRNRVARINPDGTIDLSFNIGSGANGAVYSVAIQKDGKALVAGAFTTFNDRSVPALVRLNADGSIDNTFAPEQIVGSVRKVVVADDGKILIGGAFYITNANYTAYGLARLDSDGLLDYTFNPGTGANDYVSDLVIDDVGKIVVVGAFTMFNNRLNNRIVRLMPNGSIDPTYSFGLGANDVISAVAFDKETKEILIGGAFSQFNGQVYYGFARLYGKGYLENGEFQFASSSYQFNETSQYAVIPVVRNYGALSNAIVSYRTVNGSAFAGVDYVNTAGTLQFGEAEVVKYINVPLIDNNRVDSANRYFALEIYNPANGASLGIISATSVYIADNDSVVEFESAEFNVVEGVTNARVSVVRKGGVDSTISVVCMTTTNGTATPYFDYLPTSSIIMFAPGVQRQTFNVPIFDDNEFEPVETIPVALSNLVGTASLGLSNAVIRIVDNDLGAGTISFATNYYTVAENAGEATIALIRTNGYKGTVSANISVGVGGTATPAQDYIQTNLVVTFNDGDTVKTFKVRILNDDIIEGTETLFLKIASTVGGAAIGTDLAVLAIEDDDKVGAFSFSAPEYLVYENAGAVYVNVMRTGGSIGSASVTLSTTGGTATPGLDYIATNVVLTFADGEKSKSVPIAIIDDTIVEIPETIGLMLSNPTDGAVIGAQSSATVVILDNEIGISFTSQIYRFSETSGVAAVELVRYGDTNAYASAYYNTSAGTATAGLDYISTNGVVEFQPGQTNAFITVRIIDDTIAETDETFNISLTTANNIQAGPISSATVIIEENDVVLNFSAPVYTVVEQYTNVVVTVVRSGNTNGSVSVDYQVTPGTASTFPGANIDYFSTNGTLAFLPGQLTNSFQITIWDDNLVEDNETINLALVNPVGGALLGNQRNATVIIQDNDSSIDFATTNFVAAEKSTNAVITLIRRGIATGEVSIVLSTSNLTAIAGQDYLYVSNVVRWATNDLSPKTVLIPLIDDGIPEGSEQVALILSNPTGGVTSQTNFATLTIVDDAGYISFSSPSYRVVEDEGYAVLTLIRSGGSNGAVAVKYTAIGGTASAGYDYTNATGTVAFSDGEIVKSIFIPVFDDGISESPETVVFALSDPQNGAMLGAPSSATLTIYDKKTGIIDPAGNMLIAESIKPTNNVIDPGETVTVVLGLRNSGTSDTTNLVATLLPGNGVANIQAGTQTYGVLTAAGAAVFKPFTFTATGANGTLIYATLQLTDGAKDLGRVTFTFLLGKVASSFANASKITINDNTNATPYPSVIYVANVPGVVEKVTVTLNGVSHNYPSDIDILLVSPDGKATILMSDAGNGYAINNVNLTFDGGASAAVPEDGQITSGTYRPTNYVAADYFPPSAPAGPYTADMSVFKGINPNGYWALYVVDDDRMDNGVISGGWSISFVTSEGVLPSPNLAVSIQNVPTNAFAGQEFTYQVIIRNIGVDTATNVSLVNLLPAETIIQSVSAPYGTIITNGNVITALFPTMPAGADLTINITAAPPANYGSADIRANVNSLNADINYADNSARAVFEILRPEIVAKKLTNGKVRLEWPGAVKGSVLENDALSPTGWRPVQMQINTYSGTNYLEVQPTGTAKFYKLVPQK